MPKRGENIRKRKDGRWEGRYKPNGEPNYKSVYGVSYAEVKAVLGLAKQQNADKSKGIIQEKDVESISLEWLESVKIRVKTSTYASYHTIAKSHIIPYFRGVDVSTLTDGIIELFVKTKIEKGLSPKRIRDITAILLQILKYAKKRYRMKLSGYDITLPKVHIKKITVLTAEQQEKLIKYIQNNLNRSTLGILIVLFTGLRLGELCALKWGNVDFEAGELTITKTIQRVKNLAPKAKIKTKLIIDEPKSEKSTRNIPLPLFLAEILKIFSKNHDRNEYILTGTIKPLDPRTCQNRFKAHLETAGIKDINFHATRHTFATRAIEAEFDYKSLSEILGHSSVKFTLDRYVHSSQEQKKICMAKMAKCY